MAVISWGKPKIFLGAKNSLTTANAFTKLDTPVEDSTSLTGQQGDKVEAKIEGGENEAVKIKANTYELKMNVRMAQGRTLPAVLLDANSADGFTKNNIAVALQPEDASAPGFYCGECAVSIMETFTAADGAVWEITFNPVVPSSGAVKKAVSFGTLTATEGSSTNAGKFTLGGTAVGGS